MEVGVVHDTEGAEVDETAHARIGRGPQDVAGALGVDQAQGGAAVPVPRHRDEVEDGIGAREGCGKGLGPGHVSRAGLDGVALGGREAAHDDGGPVVVTDEREDAMACVDEGGDHVAADESAGAGDEDRGHRGGSGCSRGLGRDHPLFASHGIADGPSRSPTRAKSAVGPTIDP